jgi:hypothetical protein
MAYPFGQMPTLDEFIQRVSAKYQVQRGTLSGSLTGPRGQTQVEYLLRNVNGRRVAVSSTKHPASAATDP